MTLKKIDPKVQRGLLIAASALSAVWAAVEPYLTHTEDPTVRGALMTAAGAFFGWALKRPGDRTPAQAEEMAEQRAKDRVAAARLSGTYLPIDDLVADDNGL